MIVLDASAAIELLLNTEGGRLLAGRIATERLSLHAPHLIDLEVTQAVRRYSRTGAITAARGRQALQHLQQLDLIRYAHMDFLERIWSLRDNLTAYDAVYVALTEALEATLLTFDARLAGSRGHSARIELLH